MPDTFHLFCCLPVFLLWFGPGLLITFCLVFDGCSRVEAWWKGRVYTPRSALPSSPRGRP